MDGGETSVKLAELKEFLCCPVCEGYLIDATTINECLHTFCKSCIVKHIKNDHNECPKCNTLIHERRPLDYIVHDRNKQDIVYKLVPHLYISELKKRLAARETQDIDAITKFVLKGKFLHVALMFRRQNNTCHSMPPTSSTTVSSSQKTDSPTDNSQDAGVNPIYLKCPLTVRAHHLRKLLVVKFQLEDNEKVSLLYKGDIVSDNDLISNLAQSLTFCLHYEISRIRVKVKPSVELLVSKECQTLPLHEPLDE